MASAFIIMKDGRCFARRWTGYDEILKIVSKELDELNEGKEFSEWLKLQIRCEEDPEDGEAGWGFYNSRLEKWTNRTLDLRSLTKENQDLFVRSIRLGKERFSEQGNSYSPLAAKYFNNFLLMLENAEQGNPPMEMNDWNIIAEPCREKNGPGWNEE